MKLGRIISIGLGLTLLQGIEVKAQDKDSCPSISASVASDILKNKINTFSDLKSTWYASKVIPKGAEKLCITDCLATDLKVSAAKLVAGKCVCDVTIKGYPETVQISFQKY